VLQITEKNNTYRFVIKGSDIELSFNEDGSIEMYDLEDVSHTGFIFEDTKKLNLFINAISDIVSRRNTGGVKI